jgi:hypothetical protein
MPNRHPFQSFDDVTSAGGAASERAADAVQRGERRARAKVRNAAGAVRDAEARIQREASARAAAGIDETRTDRYARVARSTAERIGTAVGRARTARTEDIVTELKDFVSKYPSSLLGAVAAGFLFGRLIRGR